MYYLVTIKGEMISGRFISKNPPAKQLLTTISKAGLYNGVGDFIDFPKGHIVSIESLEWEDICDGTGIDFSTTQASEFTENQIIRKYLDNNP